MAKYVGALSRRQLFTAVGGTALFNGALFGGVKTAWTQPLKATVPEIDRVAIRVVTDFFHHAFERTHRIGDIEVQRYAFPLSKDSPPRKAMRNVYQFRRPWG